RSIRLPSGATQAFEYAEGRLVRETDADGRSVQHEYDAAGRRSASLYAGGERVARMFTAAGEPYEVSDARRTDRVFFDRAGRAVRRLDPDGGELRYEFSAVGDLARLAAPVGGFAMGHGLGHRQQSLTDDAGAATMFEYDALGRVSAEHLPGGATRQTTYDPRGRPLQQQIVVPGRGTVFSRVHTYDKSGLLVEAREP